MNAGTPHTLSLWQSIRDLIDAEPTTGRSGEVASQILQLFPDPQEQPTLDQMEALISLAYRLGWQDREQLTVLQRKLPPPVVTILPKPDGSWLFLYDGKPRP